MFTQEEMKQLQGLFLPVNQRLEKMDERFEQIDKRFEQIDERFEQIDEKFEQIENRLVDLGESLEEVRSTTNVLAEWADRTAKKVKVAF